MHSITIRIGLLCSTLLLTTVTQAARLAIVIDDFGYRPQTENQVLNMPLAISVAILPDAPHAREMALKAHAQGREVLIHLPMAPLSKQPLERNTLRPEMSSEEIQRIIGQAINHVPYAVGMNNHMGSAMTSSLAGMQKVMQVLQHYQLYFLDSVTIARTQASKAAEGTSVKVIKRKVFLDDSQKEADIRRQLERAIQLARRNGSAIAIGHPHPSTVRVLQQMLPQLPADIVLVRPSSLLNERGTSPSLPERPPQVTPGTRPEVKPEPPKAPFIGIKQCKFKAPKQTLYAGHFFTIIANSLQQSQAADFIQRRWQVWLAAENPPVTPDEQH